MKDNKRLADDAIYLNEDRFDKPKEVHKRVGDILAQHRRPLARLLDVGCATGELVYHLHKSFPAYTVTGIDVSEAMVARARTQLSWGSFSIASILDDAWFREARFDIVTCIGVLSIFDDIEQPLRNLLACLLPGGEAVILAPFNPNPVDVIMRYRPSAATEGEWQSGWNMHSQTTVDRMLGTMPQIARWEWEEFRLPFALAKRADPMRSWTIGTQNNPYQQVNGANQLVMPHFLKIAIKA